MSNLRNLHVHFNIIAENSVSRDAFTGKVYYRFVKSNEVINLHSTCISDCVIVDKQIIYLP